MNKFERQGTILRLVGERQLATQSDVVEALRDEGLDAVQATVSRDIAQLGLVKVRGDDGRLVYALPGAADLDRLSELTSALRRWAIALEPTGNLVVLRTPPGHANALALAFDEAGAARDRGLHRRRRHDLPRRARGDDGRRARRPAAPPPGRRHVTVALPQALGVDLRGRSLARVRDWTAAEIEAVLDLADELKAKQRAREPHRLLEGRTLGLLFRKHSTRTRVSLEVAAAHLGATVALPSGRPAPARARRAVRGHGARALPLPRRDRDPHLRSMRSSRCSTAAATIPVVNALTDEAHPLQALADLQTMRERFGAVEGLRVAWIGDGNNVCLSLAEACALLGAELVCAAPPGYEPDDASIPVVRDPREAVAGAHVVVTDVWTSMGQEAESAERLRAFAGYTVDDALLALADPEAIVLHCLPAHPGEEIARTSSTAPAAPPGTRRRTGCTPPRLCSR